MTNDLVPRPERAPTNVRSLPVARNGPADPDDAWHDTLVLISALTSMNRQIAVFVLRVMDADAGRKDPPAPAVGYALGARLIKLGNTLQSSVRAHGTGDADVYAPQFACRSRRRREPQTPWTGGRSAIYGVGSE